jgi:hypothetical protein
MVSVLWLAPVMPVRRPKVVEAGPEPVSVRVSRS